MRGRVVVSRVQSGMSGSMAGPQNEFGNLPRKVDAHAKHVRRGHPIEEVRRLPDRPAPTMYPVWGPKPPERRGVVEVFTGK